MKKVRPLMWLFCAAALAVALLGANLNARLVQEDRDQALFVAIEARDVAACEVAIRAGGDPNALRPASAGADSSTVSVATRLRRLFTLRRAKAAEQTMPRGNALAAALPSERDRLSHRDEAARCVVAALLARGADPNGAMYSMRPLCAAAWQGDTRAMQQLLDAGASVNGSGRDGATPLMCAANVGDAPAVLFLLRRRAEINRRDADGQTALHRAVNYYYVENRTNKSETVRRLLAAGADARLRDKNGDTALVVAVRNASGKGAVRYYDPRQRQENHAAAELLRRASALSPQPARKP